jgi:hypothetical protein
MADGEGTGLILNDLALQQGAREVGARFIDAGHEAFSSSDLQNYSADGLHLNNLGHAALASFMAGKMVDLGLVPLPPAAQAGKLHLFENRYMSNSY